MTLCVTLNTITLAVDSHGISKSAKAQLNDFNFYFTIIFIIEMGIKLLGLGVISEKFFIILLEYMSDKMNYLDGSVVLLSIVELAFLGGGGGAVSAFRTVRIFRTFRVLRVARLLRSMQSMQVIIGVIGRSMGSFMYLAMLLTLFIFIYSLLGMQLFGGKFNFPEGLPRGNYDSFGSAFITVFQVLTMENWQYIMYDGMRSDAGALISAIYFISWIFIGNFMLLNLFLAILLDSFVDEDEDVKEMIGGEVTNQEEEK
jgi:hypothetical protein